MTDERYKYLNEHIDAPLTVHEFNEGWHFCMEFDGLLVKGDPTKDVCGKECIEWARGDEKGIK